MSLKILSWYDLKKLCLICLQIPSDKDYLNVHSICDTDRQLSYTECLFICTQINLSDGCSDDLVPLNLCQNCGRDLQTSYNFYKRVEQTKSKLEDYIKTVKNTFTQQNSVLLADDHKTNEEIIEEDEGTFECPFVKIDDLIYEEEQTSNIIENCDDIIEEHLEEHLQLEELDENVTDANELISEEISNVVYEDVIETVEDNVEDHIINEIPATVTKILPNDGSEKYNEKEDEEKAKGEQKQLQNVIENIEDNCEKRAQIKRRSERHIGSYSCNICNKVFPNYSRMCTHRRCHESDRHKYLCFYCDRLYCTKQALNIHVKTVHKKTGYVCPMCSKVFAIKKNLEIHIRYHTGDFPYECDMCNRKFAQIGHLNTHKNVKHNNVRFFCEYPDCGKYFTSSNSLRNHEFSHGVMPFECTLCRQGCPSKAKLKAHLKSKHCQEVTREQLEDMRKFHIVRSKVNVVKLMEIRSQL